MIEKYFMSQRTLNVVKKCSKDEHIYKGCPIEIDNSIPYGLVEDRFSEKHP